MQLVMRRARIQKSNWYDFKINARMVISDEERALLNKYQLAGVKLTEGNRRRDFIIAGVSAGVVTFIITPVGIAYGMPLAGALLVFALLSGLIYHQIREDIRVKDLLTGRDFKAKSFLDLLQKEHMIRKTSAVFAKVVEQAKTWEEPEVIDLEPQPLLTVLEGGIREAA